MLVRGFQRGDLAGGQAGDLRTAEPAKETIAALLEGMPQ